MAILSKSFEKLLEPSKSLERLRAYDMGEDVKLKRKDMFILDVMTRPDIKCVFGKLIQDVVRLRGEDATTIEYVEETRSEADGVYMLNSNTVPLEA